MCERQEVKPTIFFSVASGSGWDLGSPLLASSLLVVTDFSVKCRGNLLSTKIPGEGFGS